MWSGESGGAGKPSPSSEYGSVTFSRETSLGDEVSLQTLRQRGMKRFTRVLC